MSLKAPFPWFGGKSRAADLVWSCFGDIGNYVEPFAGSLAVLLCRPHEPRIETVNDADCYLANFWRAVKSDPEQVAHWADWPVNEADLQARHRWLCDQANFRDRVKADPDFRDAKIAGWWVWGISQWIGAGWCSRPEWIGRGGGGRAPRGLNAQAPHLSSSNGIHANLDGLHKRPVINRGARGVTLHGGKQTVFSAGITKNTGGVHGRKIRGPENPDWQHSPDLRSNGVHNKRPHLSGNGQVGVCSKRGIVQWMVDLSDRLRKVRVCCGDWARVVTPSCTWKLGGGQLTAIFLDPPYSHEMRDNRLYSVETDVAADVRAWAIENGNNRNLRIALCGLEGEHQMPDSWTLEHWRAPRGYSNKAPRREVIWFSPFCLRPQIDLFSNISEASA